MTDFDMPETLTGKECIAKWKEIESDRVKELSEKLNKIKEIINDGI